MAHNAHDPEHPYILDIFRVKGKRGRLSRCEQLCAITTSENAMSFQVDGNMTAL